MLAIWRNGAKRKGIQGKLEEERVEDRMKRLANWVKSRLTIREKEN